MNVTREYLIGASAGFSLTVPLLGRFMSVPASALGLIFPCIAVVLLLGSRIRLTNATVFLLVLLGLYVAGVVQSAAPEQFEFFTKVSNWLNNADHYYEAKLLKFALALVPGLVAALCFALIGKSGDAFRGFNAAIAVVAVLAALKLMQHSDILMGTSYETAARYFRNPYEMGHSAVSYGILFCLGTAAAMTMRRLWLLSALFIFMLFLIGRRVELVLAVGTVFAFSAWHFLDGPLRRLEPWRFAPVLLIAASLSFTLYNDATLARWGTVAQSAEQRLEIISDGMIARAEAQTEAAQPEEKPKQETPADKAKFGNGLGWYSTLGQKHPYPHNLVLETFLESGALTTVWLLLFLGVGFYLPARTKMTPHSLALLIMIGSLIAVSLKAGDAVAGARIIGFVMIASVFRWPLLDSLVSEVSPRRSATG